MAKKYLTTNLVDYSDFKNKYTEITFCLHFNLCMQVGLFLPL